MHADRLYKPIDPILERYNKSHIYDVLLSKLDNYRYVPEDVEPPYGTFVAYMYKCCVYNVKLFYGNILQPRGNRIRIKLYPGGIIKDISRDKINLFILMYKKQQDQAMDRLIKRLMVESILEN